MNRSESITVRSTPTGSDWIVVTGDGQEDKKTTSIASTAIQRMTSSSPDMCVSPDKEIGVGAESYGFTTIATMEKLSEGSLAKSPNMCVSPARENGAEKMEVVKEFFLPKKAPMQKVSSIFPKIDEITREAPDQLIPLFFRHLNSGANVKRKEYIENAIIENVDRMSSAEIIKIFQQQSFSLGANPEAPDYNVKKALIGAFYMKGDRNYQKLQQAFIDSRQRLDMIVFRGRFPSHAELEELPLSIPGSVKVICVEGDFSITALPKSLAKWRQLQEVRLNNCPNFTKYRSKEGLPNLTGIIVDGKRYIPKSERGKY
jgi:hypothetical protein